MATFTPASSDAWTFGHDQVGRSCWQNKQTKELHYSPPGQGLPPPPKGLMDAPPTKVPSDYLPPPPSIPIAQGFPLGQPQGFGQGVQFHASPFKAPEPKTVQPASVKVETKPGPSPLLSKAEEAKQWSCKRDDRGEYYFNSVTGKSQFAKPDCFKKYTLRR